MAETGRRTNHLSDAFAAVKARTEDIIGEMYGWQPSSDNDRERISQLRHVFDIAFNAGFEAAERALTREGD